MGLGVSYEDANGIFRKIDVHNLFAGTGVSPRFFDLREMEGRGSVLDSLICEKWSWDDGHVFSEVLVSAACGMEGLERHASDCHRGEVGTAWTESVLDLLNCEIDAGCGEV
jgi:hypothetical protein